MSYITILKWSYTTNLSKKRNMQQLNFINKKRRIKMKKNLSLIVFVALAVSVINVFAIINSSNDSSIQAYAKSNLCTAQGDFMPAPFEEVIVEEISNESNGNVCSAQGDVRPPAWDEEEEYIPSTS